MPTVNLELNAPYAKKALAPIFSVINTSTVLPILEDVLIRKNEDIVEFCATDLENSLTIGLQADNSMNGQAFCFPAASLKKLISDAILPTLLFSFDDKLNSKVINGDFSLVSVLDYAGDFPVIPKVENGRVLKVDGKKFVELLINALAFVSTDDLRLAMTGVHLCDWQGKIYIVATDAHRLYFEQLMETPVDFIGFKTILPPKAARLITIAFKSGEMQAYFSASHTNIRQGNKSLVSRLIDAKYLNFEVVLQRQDLKFYLKRKDFKAFLKLAAPFTNKSTYQINVQVSEQSIAVVGGDSDFRFSFDYKMPVYNISQKFEPFSFGINAKFFLDALKVKSKDEYVKIEHSQTATKNVIIDDCILIMPLMLKS